MLTRKKHCEFPDLVTITSIERHVGNQLSDRRVPKILRTDGVLHIVKSVSEEKIPVSSPNPRRTIKYGVIYDTKQPRMTADGKP